MTISPRALDDLKALLQTVSPQPLVQGLVGEKYPGILAGKTPVCRLRGTPESAAYGRLIVEAVNNLPALIESLLATREMQAEAAPSVQAAPAPATTLAAHPQRPEVEAAIANTLLMQQGFQRSMATLWSRLIFAAIEPWLKGGRETLNTREIIQDTPKPACAAPALNGDERLDAVMSFCTYLMAQKDQDNMPNEHALEQLVNAWAESEQKAEAA